MIRDGFKRYSIGENPTFFLAPWYMASYVYVLPAHLVSEHKSLPDHIASLRVAFKDENGALALGGIELFDNPYHTILIRQKLTASLERLLEPVRDELETAFKEEWEQKWVGTENEEGWVDIPVFKVAAGVVSRGVNRAFSGMSICRDKDFMKSAVEFSMGVIIAGFGMQICPRELQWLLEPLIAFRNRRRIAFAAKKLRPIFEERKAIIEHNMKNKEDQMKVPEDLLQFVIEEAERLGPPDNSIEQLATRYMNMNFVSLLSTSMTFAHSLSNMAAYQDSTGGSYWDLIHEEVLAVDNDSEEGPGVWTRKKLNRLVGMDSFIRETLRLHMTPAIGMIRKVIAKEGYTYSNGTHLKRGMLIGVPSLSIHRDQDGMKAGANADEFIGFRFSRPYQELLENASAEDISATSRVGKFSATTLSDQFVPFGGGVRECPGKFFGVAVVKLCLTYCVLNYELKAQERASPRYIWGKQGSHFDLKLKIRKRREPNVSS